MFDAVERRPGEIGCRPRHHHQPTMLHAVVGAVMRIRSRNVIWSGKIDVTSPGTGIGAGRHVEIADRPGLDVTVGDAEPRSLTEYRSSSRNIGGPPTAPPHGPRPDRCTNVPGPCRADVLCAAKLPDLRDVDHRVPDGAPEYCSRHRRLRPERLVDDVSRSTGRASFMLKQTVPTGTR